MSSEDNSFMEGFTTLLTDIQIRNRFAEDPRAVAAVLCTNPSAAATLAALDPKGLHHQADVLLRKRYARIKPYMPSFVEEPPGQGWLKFRNYIEQCDSRENRESLLMEAESFLQFAAKMEGISPQRDLNRLRFLLNQQMRWEVKVFLHETSRGRKSPALQILLRQGTGCRDFLLYL